MKFCFDLFDDDSNGKICVQDLDHFFKQYGGVCHLLTSDYKELSQYLNDKITGFRPPYDGKS